MIKNTFFTIQHSDTSSEDEKDWISLSIPQQTAEAAEKKIGFLNTQLPNKFWRIIKIEEFKTIYKTIGRVQNYF